MATAPVFDPRSVRMSRCLESHVHASEMRSLWAVTESGHERRPHNVELASELCYEINKRLPMSSDFALDSVLDVTGSGGLKFETWLRFDSHG